MLALPSAYMGTYMEERFWMHYTLEHQRAGVAEVLQDFNRKVWNQTKPNHLNLFFFPTLNRQQFALSPSKWIQ